MSDAILHQKNLSHWTVLPNVVTRNEPDFPSKIFILYGRDTLEVAAGNFYENHIDILMMIILQKILPQ